MWPMWPHARTIHQRCPVQDRSCAALSFSSIMSTSMPADLQRSPELNPHSKEFQSDLPELDKRTNQCDTVTGLATEASRFADLRFVQAWERDRDPCVDSVELRRPKRTFTADCVANCWRYEDFAVKIEPMLHLPPTSNIKQCWSPLASNRCKRCFSNIGNSPARKRRRQKSAS